MCELKIRVTPETKPCFASPCCHWTGAHDARGYARVKLRGSSTYVRRVLFEENGRKLPRNRHVVALCGDPGCVNAEHLVVGTERETKKLAHRGFYSVGMIWTAKRALERGETTLAFLSRVCGISKPLLARAMAACD